MFNFVMITVHVSFYYCGKILNIYNIHCTQIMIMLSLVGPDMINKIIIASYIPQRIKIMDLFQFSPKSSFK